MKTDTKKSQITIKLVSASATFSGMVALFYDDLFSCASNQVAQVLLTLPYSFSQLVAYLWSFMAFWEAGLIISLVFCMLSTEAGRRKKMLTSRTMSSRNKRK